MDSLGEIGESVESVETEVARVEGQIESIFIAADYFDGFMDGLRQLLREIEITREAAPVSPSNTSSDSDENTVPTVSPEPSIPVTETVSSATRTPRPTFTPLGDSSASPAGTP